MEAICEIANLTDAIEPSRRPRRAPSIGEMDLDETLSSGDTIDARPEAVLDDATSRWASR
ncbi:MAG TPA: hypothetical protein VIM86_14540 [Thermodesulfobacteriota bacterium]